MAVLIASAIANIPSGGRALVIVEFDDPGTEVWLKINDVESEHRSVAVEQQSITIMEIITIAGVNVVEAWTG